jgi:predicted MFS family arabinose efflux permease
MFRFGDWRLIFYAGGGAAMLLAPVILLLGREPQTFAPPPKAVAAGPSADGLFSPRYRRRTLTLCATQFISLTAIFCLMSWLPTVLAKATGSASTASLLTSLVYFGSVVGVLLMAAVINRVGVERLLVTILLVAAATSAALHFTVADLGLGVIIGLTLMGIGLLGGQVTLNNLGVIVYPPEMRGRGVGLGMGIGRIGALIGPAIGGAVLASQSYHNDLFLIVAVLILAAAGSVLAFGYARRAAGGAEEPA